MKPFGMKSDTYFDKFFAKSPPAGQSSVTKNPGRGRPRSLNPKSNAQRQREFRARNRSLSAQRKAMNRFLLEIHNEKSSKERRYAFGDVLMLAIHRLGGLSAPW